MNDELKSFIEKARLKNLNNDEIKAKLLAAGWSQEMVRGILDDDLVAPAPPTNRGNDAPSPLSKREESIKLKMFECNIMFLTLWIVAIAAFWIINVFLFTSDTSAVTFPLTALLVCLPVFLILLFRMRAHDRDDPELRHVAARLHMAQSSQALAFIILLIHTIYMVYQLLSGSDNSAFQLLSFAGSLVIFGGIFSYYWVNTHRASLGR